MNEAEQARSLPIMGVYWFLALVAFTFVFFALREVWRIRELKPLRVRVVERTVQTEVRLVPATRSSRNIPFLFAVMQLRLERLDTHAAVSQTVEQRLSDDEFVTLQFMDRWQPGATMAAAERDGVLELDPANPWLAAMGLGLVAWMMGTFAWMVKPFAEGGNTGGKGVKFLALALLPLGVAVFGIGRNVLKDREEKALQRVAVEGRSKRVLVADLVAELARMGVKAGDDVRKHFGDADETVDYCEFVWQGKTWRAKSLWCQPMEGVAIAGRLNPGNPRDVKWGEEP